MCGCIHIYISISLYIYYIIYISSTTRRLARLEEELHALQVAKRRGTNSGPVSFVDLPFMDVDVPAGEHVPQLFKRG